MARTSARWIDTVPDHVRSSTDPQTIDAVVSEVQRMELLLREVVYVCRENGWTWDQIAVGLGTTKSAAFQRFSKIDPEAERWPSWQELHASGE
jgi:hypothetical protein